MMPMTARTRRAEIESTEAPPWSGFVRGEGTSAGGNGAKAGEESGAEVSEAGAGLSEDRAEGTAATMGDCSEEEGVREEGEKAEGWLLEEEGGTEELERGVGAEDGDS